MILGLFLLGTCAILLTSRLIAAHVAIRHSAELERQFEHRSADQPIGANGHIHVLLPCLREQGIVAETLDYFSRLAEPHVGAVSLVPITGESETLWLDQATASLAWRWWRRLVPSDFEERPEGMLDASQHDAVVALRSEANSEVEFARSLAGLIRGAPTTRDAIHAWLASNASRRDLVVPLHEPATTGTKATKLNYAVSALGCSEPGCFMAVYDFDARPHPQTFAYALYRMRGRPPRILQQTPFQFLGLGVMEPASAGAFEAIWHSNRGLGVETYMALARERKWPLWFGLTYCMGSGLVVDRAAVEQVGGFPEYNDDIAFGYRLEWHDITERALIPYPAFVRAPESFQSMRGQFTRIYLGVFSAAYELRRARSRGMSGRASMIRIVLCHAQDLLPLLALVTAAVGVGFLATQSVVAAVAGAAVAWLIHLVAWLIARRHANYLGQRYLGSPVSKLSVSSALLGPLFMGPFVGLAAATYLYRFIRGIDRLAIAGGRTDRSP